jgi:hypothetical protein
MNDEAIPTTVAANRNSARARRGRLIPLLFPAFGGFVFLTVGLVFAADSLSAISGAQRTEGEIIGRMRRGRPIIRFQVDGQTYEIAGSVGSSGSTYSVGERVTVAYKPDHAEDGRLVSFTELWLIPVSAITAAMLAFFMAAFIWRAARRRANLIERMKVNKSMFAICALAIWLAGCGNQKKILWEGEASGTFTAAGEMVTVKYAYAQRGGRYGQNSIRVLVTDKPIAKETAVNEEEYQRKVSAGELRGLEYSIEEDSFRVMFLPGLVQMGDAEPLREFSIENESVRGRDEASGTIFTATIGGKEKLTGVYARSVSFVAPLLPKKQP